MILSGLILSRAFFPSVKSVKSVVKLLPLLVTLWLSLFFCP
jgi:hypothetical protein